MAVIKGREVYIYSGTSGTTPIIAGAKSCTVSRKCDIMEKASASNQTSKEFLAGREEWEVSLNHLVTSGAPFEGLLKVGQTYTLRIVIGSTAKTGTAICTQADIGGTVGNLATGSIRFKGTGHLS